MCNESAGDEDELILESSAVNRNWADLPNEFLCKIFSRLSARDRVEFQCVCKSWKSESFAPIKLGHPYLMERKLRPEYNNNLCIPRFEQSEVWAVKDGWLLFINEQSSKFSTRGIFFYNPLTKTRVDLPNLPIPNCPIKYPSSVCFSAPPTSKDWVVVVAIFLDDRVIMYSLRCHHKFWRHCEFDTNEKYMSSTDDYPSAVIYKGDYYFLGEDATLLIYHPKTKRLDIHKAPESISELVKDKGSQRYILETTNGNVLAVFASTDGSSVCACKWINQNWEILQSLEDENDRVFVSRTSSFYERSTIKGNGNRIYFPRIIRDHPLFYSLSSKRYHTFEMGTSYGRFHGSKLPLRSAWIKLAQS